ncbi:beta-ketoacyl-ACP synthase II [Candidatus Margulisiibacteriota bacterium]
MGKKRVVITGIGIVSPVGLERETFWNAVTNGKPNFSKISSFSTSPFRTKIAAEIKEFNPESYFPKKVINQISRFAQFALIASKLSLSDTHVKLDTIDKNRFGIILGTGIGGIDITERQHRDLTQKGINEINPHGAAYANPNAASGYVAYMLGAKGPNITISTGCSSGLNAIGIAYDMIQNDRADIIIAGGVEAPITPLVFSTFDASRQMSIQNNDPNAAVKPFDKNRDGFLLSEGAGIVLLESVEHALSRMAYLYGEIIGYGVTSDAFNDISVDPQGSAAAEAMKSALINAHCDPKDIDVLFAHASSSKLGDRKEANAIKKVFAPQFDTLKVTSIKGVTGMPFGAAGGFQLAASLLGMEYGEIPPTIGTENIDPECELPLVLNKKQTAAYNTALINSFGIGGNNTSLIVRRGNVVDKVTIKDLSEQTKQILTETGQAVKQSSYEQKKLHLNVDEFKRHREAEVSSHAAERQQKALEFLKKNKRITNKEYRLMFNISHKTAYFELLDLVERKIIEPQGMGRSTGYVLKQKNND